MEKTKQMAFRQSLIRLAGKERHDVASHLHKWWKKYHFVEGHITQRLSPFELKVTETLFDGMATRAVKKVVSFVKEAGFGLGVSIFVFKWGLWKHEEIAYHHRD